MTAQPAPLCVLALHWAVSGEPARLAVERNGECLRLGRRSPAAAESNLARLGRVA